MKKNRNAFFAENNMSFSGYDSMMGPMPYQNMHESSSYYAGNMPMDNNVFERLAKLERQMSRLEHRISKLENTTNISSTDDYESTTNNMYII